MHIADALLDLSLSDLRHFARIASRPRNSTGIFLYVNARFNQWHDRPTLLSRVRLTFVYFSSFEHAILPRYTFPIDSRHATYDRNMYTFYQSTNNRRWNIDSIAHCRNDRLRYSLFTCHVSSCTDARRNEFSLPSLSLVPKTFRIGFQSVQNDSRVLISVNDLIAIYVINTLDWTMTQTKNARKKWKTCRIIRHRSRTNS